MYECKIKVMNFFVFTTACIIELCPFHYSELHNEANIISIFLFPSFSGINSNLGFSI